MSTSFIPTSMEARDQPITGGDTGVSHGGLARAHPWASRHRIQLKPMQHLQVRTLRCNAIASSDFRLATSVTGFPSSRRRSPQLA